MIQAHLSTTPTLDLRWLHPPKDLPLPAVAWSDETHVGGYCVQPWPGVHRVGPAELERESGLIVVCAASKDPASTLAHEYRHHLQHLAGCHYDGIGWTAQSMESYRESIVEYFTRSWCELDALRFELEVAPCEVSLTWWEWIREATK